MRTTFRAKCVAIHEKRAVRCTLGPGCRPACLTFSAETSRLPSGANRGTPRAMSSSMIDPQVFRAFSMDFTFEIHHAKRDDGQWFSRRQERTSRGYQWSAWGKSVAPDMERATPVDVSVRLPVDGAAPRAKRGPSCRVVSCRKGATCTVVYSAGTMVLDRRACCGSATCLASFRSLVGAKSETEVTVAPLAA